jgi:hypothetical protein
MQRTINTTSGMISIDLDALIVFTLAIASESIMTFRICFLAGLFYWGNPSFPFLWGEHIPLNYYCTVIEEHLVP